MYDGKESRFDRSDILGVVKSGEIPPWAQEKIAKMREKDKAVVGDKPSVMDEIKQSQQEARKRPTKTKDVPSKKKSETEL